MVAIVSEETWILQQENTIENEEVLRAQNLKEMKKKTQHFNFFLSHCNNPSEKSI